MQSTMKILIPLFLFSSVVASSYYTWSYLRRLNSPPVCRTLEVLNDLLSAYSDCDVFADEWKEVMRVYLTLCENSSAKLRRDGILNLYPFPRVGRASRNTWQAPLNDLYLDDELVDKRQLYPHPRIGRSGLSLLRGESSHDFAPMSVRRTEIPGMWFGPRLGRTYKGDDDADISLHETSEHSDPEQTDPVHVDREKRQAN